MLTGVGPRVERCRERSAGAAASVTVPRWPWPGQHEHELPLPAHASVVPEARAREAAPALPRWRAALNAVRPSSSSAPAPRGVHGPYRPSCTQAFAAAEPNHATAEMRGCAVAWETGKSPHTSRRRSPRTCTQERAVSTRPAKNAIQPTVVAAASAGSDDGQVVNSRRTRSLLPGRGGSGPVTDVACRHAWIASAERPLAQRHASSQAPPSRHLIAMSVRRCRRTLASPLPDCAYGMLTSGPVQP
jgi:hypothetical protein